VKLSGRLANLARALGPLLPSAIAVLGLAELGRSGALGEVGGALGALVLSELLRRSALGVLGALWIVPAVLGFAIVAALAVPTILSELLAGLAGLSLLYWISGTTSGRSEPSRASSGLLLPALSVALALLVTLFLPRGPAEFGAASLILAGVLLALGWAIRTDVGRPDDRSAPS
jgi:hypothetical protein